MEFNVCNLQNRNKMRKIQPFKSLLLINDLGFLTEIYLNSFGWEITWFFLKLSFRMCHAVQLDAMDTIILTKKPLLMEFDVFSLQNGDKLRKIQPLTRLQLIRYLGFLTDISLYSFGWEITWFFLKLSFRM